MPRMLLDLALITEMTVHGWLVKGHSFSNYYLLSIDALMVNTLIVEEHSNCYHSLLRALFLRYCLYFRLSTEVGFCIH